MAQKNFLIILLSQSLWNRQDRGSIDYHGRKFGFHEGHYAGQGQPLICPSILPDPKYRAMEKMGLFFFFSLYTIGQ